MNLAPVLAAVGGEGGVAGGGAGAGGVAGWIIYLGFIGVLMYFIIIRPQKKQRKQHLSVVDSLETGDSVLTSGGFYGVVIDVMDNIIIVEFGNNKNCRIPMKKDAVVEVEKPAKPE